MNYYIYKLTNEKTGEYYYGKRTTKNHWAEDKYFGSSHVLKNRCGGKLPTQERLPDWRKEVLLLLDTPKELDTFEKICIGEQWRKEYPLCLNKLPGGIATGDAHQMHTPEIRAKAVEGMKRWAQTDEGQKRLSNMGKSGSRKALESGNHISKKDPSHMSRIGALGAKGKKWMTNQETSKLVKPEMQQQLLDEGWTYGRSNKDKNKISAKTKDAMADPNIMDKYMKGRWNK